MNIIYVIEDFSENGGVERIVSMKASLLASRYGHQVSLISVYHDDRPERYSLDERVHLYHLNVPFAKKMSNPIAKLYSRVRTLLLAAHRLNEVVRTIHPDVIFFTTTLGALLLPLCHSKAKKIYESHLARKFNPYHILFFAMERKADEVVCLTQDDAKEFKKAKKVEVIPNFIDMPTHTVKDYSCRKAIAVGRLETQKGFDRLIHCWIKVAQQHPDWQLDIYGEGSQHAALQKQIDDLKLNKQITLCGRNEKLMDIYPNYSLHVMSSYYEGLPMVMIEAQACGLPSVAFDFQYGASDVIRDKYNGFIVEQDNETAFTEAVLNMVESSSLREEYGKNARHLAQKYSKENVFIQWQKFLDGLK